jgi:hypothetical protein
VARVVLDEVSECTVSQELLWLWDRARARGQSGNPGRGTSNTGSRYHKTGEGTADFACVCVVVKALCYKPEGRGFETR